MYLMHYSYISQPYNALIDIGHSAWILGATLLSESLTLIDFNDGLCAHTW